MFLKAFWDVYWLSYMLNDGILNLTVIEVLGSLPIHVIPAAVMCYLLPLLLQALRSIGYRTLPVEDGVPYDAKLGIVPNISGRVIESELVHSHAHL